MSGVSPIISIITPTFNRADEIDLLLESINNQTIDYSLFEMIIADDGSTDSTEDLIAGWQQKTDFELKYFTQDNQGPGSARNLGLKEAVGELFVFIDSDCEAHQTWLETIYAAYQNNEFDACGGPDSAKDDFTPIQKAIDFSMTSFLTTGGMRGHSEKMIAKFYPRSHNMAMRRSVYDKVGGFGSLRHGQDIELSHRIHKSGARVKFLKNAVVYHRRRTTLKKFFRQVFNWGVARINLGKIDKSMLEPIHFLPAAATLLAILVIMGNLVNPSVFFPIFLFGITSLLLISIIAVYQSKSIKVGFYTSLTIPFQIFGYGSGFIIQFIKRYIFGMGEWRGFSKRYYH